MIIASQTRRSSNTNMSGFTLLELLVVLAIIGVLIGIIFPVLVRSRERARETTCTSNLRQIGISFRMYMQDNDNGRPPYLDRLVPHYLNPRILVCQSDPSGNYSNLYLGQLSMPPIRWMYPQSYDYFVIPYDNEMWNALEALGGKAGYVVDRLHGTRIQDSHETGMPQYRGRELRLEMDGSVKVIDTPYSNMYPWGDLAYYPGSPLPAQPL